MASTYLTFRNIFRTRKHKNLLYLCGLKDVQMDQSRFDFGNTDGIDTDFISYFDSDDRFRYIQIIVVVQYNILVTIENLEILMLGIILF